MTKTKKITSFNVSWTANHERFYPGHSIVFSDYTHTGKGCGETLREAFDDAVQDLHEQLLDMTEALADIVDGLTAELTGQVKDPEMLDWDIVRAECPTRGTHSCMTDDGDLIEDTEPDCAVCAGEWHFYVNVDVQVEGDENESN